MIYIGNFADWIQPDYIDFLLENQGIPKPNGIPEDDQAKGIYDFTKIFYYQFDQTNFPFKITCPFSKTREYSWWIIKMLPGNIIPIHVDPHARNSSWKNVNRYWMALQDWELGHIFMYENVTLVDYKKGDVFQYPQSNGIHGACNIGYNTRLVFQFTTFERK